MRPDRVPDVHPESDDPRLLSQERLCDFPGRLHNLKLNYSGVTLELGHIGVQAPKPRGCVDVAGIEGTQEDTCHSGAQTLPSGANFPALAQGRT